MEFALLTPTRADDSYRACSWRWERLLQTRYERVFSCPPHGGTRDWRRVTRRANGLANLSLGDDRQRAGWGCALLVLGHRRPHVWRDVPLGDLADQRNGLSGDRLLQHDLRTRRALAGRDDGQAVCHD